MAVVPVPQNSEEMLPSRSLQRQRLLADVAQLFLGVEAFPKQIHQALGWIGADANVSRIYIFEDSPDGTTTSNTYEWCNTGIEPQIQELQDVPYAYIPNWKAILDRDGRIFSTNIQQELPDDLLAVLEPQGIKSILIIPLQKFESRFGFIGFDECTQNREWALEDLELLRSLSGIISAAYEREHIRAELKLGEIRLTMALENAGTGLWDWNIDTQALLFNADWARMFNMAEVGQPKTMNDWEQLIHPSDVEAFIQARESHMSGHKNVFENNHRIKTQEGIWKWVRVQGKLLACTPETKTRRMLGTQIDIDKQKKIEEELRHLNTSKDLFFTVLAHDLKAPLLSMMQMANSTKNNPSFSQLDWEALLAAQENMAKNSLNLLENLFHWAGFQKGALAYFPENVNALELVKTEIEHLQGALNFKSLQLDLSNFKAQHVFADAVLLSIVFRNLLHNAIKFSHKKGRIYLRSWENNTHVCVEIQDYGLGIPPEFVETLLNDDSFKSSFGTNNEHGSGIGLKICKRFIQQQGGTLTFQSALGEGTTFQFSLPAAIHKI